MERQHERLRTELARISAELAQAEQQVQQASVVTGAKTVMDYLMRPVYRGLNPAFRER